MSNLSREEYYGWEWNVFIKLDPQFDMLLTASLAPFHHREEGLPQDFGRNVLGPPARLDQCDEPEVGCRTDRSHAGRACRQRCAGRHQVNARCGRKSATAVSNRMGATFPATPSQQTGAQTCQTTSAFLIHTLSTTPPPPAIYCTC